MFTDWSTLPSGRTIHCSVLHAQAHTSYKCRLYIIHQIFSSSINYYFLLLLIYHFLLIIYQIICKTLINPSNFLLVFALLWHIAYHYLGSAWPMHLSLTDCPLPSPGVSGSTGACSPRCLRCLS